ncbi:hypothetical protein AYX14_05120 [Cryptococcus neoformans]|nr:hypothetical protein AYX14_05120 [Cryptococcus neoformans var. grubii]OXG10948.1 hypothetical protein C366_06451 [Cryptococcus neoformans var. grubii Tu401-1]OXM75886.1 hypothetical protein C364_06436 [Cryptococcus neoformans var. grubii Bt63]
MEPYLFTEKAAERDYQRTIAECGMIGCPTAHDNVWNSSEKRYRVRDTDYPPTTLAVVSGISTICRVAGLQCA